MKIGPHANLWLSGSLLLSASRPQVDQGFYIQTKHGAIHASRKQTGDCHKVPKYCLSSMPTEVLIYCLGKTGTGWPQPPLPPPTPLGGMIPSGLPSSLRIAPVITILNWGRRKRAYVLAFFSFFSRALRPVPLYILLVVLTRLSFILFY